MSAHNRRSGGPVLPLFVVLASAALALSQSPGPLRQMQDVSPDSVSSPDQKVSYYALLIGNAKYQSLARLETPNADATAIATLLKDKYGFETQVLLDASRTDILDALVSFRKSLHKNANLLVFYAGHGYFDTEAGEAYWLPVDARADNNSDWISMDDITSRIRPLASRHVLVISDSCYSGAILTDGSAHSRGLEELTGGIPTEYAQYLQKMQSLASRNWMASGGMEPVADGGAPGHSLFANALLQGLQQSPVSQFSASDLFYSFVRRKVAGATRQLPQYGSIRDSGDDLGDFVFIRNAALSGKTAAAPPSPLPAPQPADHPAPGDAGNQAVQDVQSCLSSHERGSLSDEDYVSCVRTDAYQGQARAMAYLGRAYEFGVGGLSRDQNRAVVWYRKAADLGDPDGMLNLGMAYAYGKGGLPLDVQQTLTWYTKAANAGNAQAMMVLGDIALKGYKGLQPDLKQALTWHQKAADAGNVRSMRILGDCYVEGSCGVPKDLPQARNWFEKAATLGDKTAMVWMGNRYEEGTDGFPKDHSKAQEWFQKAADQQKLDLAAHKRKN